MKLAKHVLGLKMKYSIAIYCFCIFVGIHSCCFASAKIHSEHNILVYELFLRNANIKNLPILNNFSIIKSKMINKKSTTKTLKYIKEEIKKLSIDTVFIISASNLKSNEQIVLFAKNISNSSYEKYLFLLGNNINFSSIRENACIHTPRVVNISTEDLKKNKSK